MDRTQLEARETENLRAEAIVEDVTGAKRSEVGVRFDLIPTEGPFELARRFFIGATKYGDNNWKKGLTGKNSPLNHLEKHINEYKAERAQGKRIDEMSDAHLGAILWNATAELYFRSHPEWYDETNALRPELELDSLGRPKLKYPELGTKECDRFVTDIINESAWLLSKTPSLYEQGQSLPVAANIPDVPAPAIERSPGVTFLTKIVDQIKKF